MVNKKSVNLKLIIPVVVLLIFFSFFVFKTPAGARFVGVLGKMVSPMKFLGATTSPVPSISNVRVGTGVVWATGNTETIAWSSTSVPTINVYAVGQNGTRVLIKTGTNYGTYNWKIPALSAIPGSTAGTNGQGYKGVMFTVESATNPNVKASSPSYVITNKINVTKPSGGEEVPEGGQNPFRISYTSQGIIGGVNIFLTYLNSAGKEVRSEQIASGLTSTYFDWLVSWISLQPGEVITSNGKTYNSVLIKIVSVSDPNVWAKSQKFKIVKTQMKCGLCMYQDYPNCNSFNDTAAKCGSFTNQTSCAAYSNTTYKNICSWYLYPDPGTKNCKPSSLTCFALSEEPASSAGCVLNSRDECHLF